MFAKPPISPGPEASKQFEAWIDRAVRDQRDPIELAAGIASVTQPGGTGSYEVSPELFGNEAWFWPWNRAGFAYLRDEHPEPAATIFTCAYLAAIQFQRSWQYRIHKGMPLCNVAYAYLKANNPTKAGLPALLGMAEDAMTAGNPTETPSFRNLLAAGYPEVHARSAGEFFLILTRMRGTFFLYPEAILDCVHRGNALPSPEMIKTMQTIAEEFSPDTVAPSLEKLARAWESIEAVYTRAASTSGANYGAFPVAGWIPVTGPDAPGNRGPVPSPGDQGGSSPGGRGDFPSSSGAGGR
jgi:hypothetical protein